MKRRLFYFISPIAIIISLLASFGFTGTASAAYSTNGTVVGQKAATWCKNHQYSSENYCNEPYILGYSIEPHPSDVSSEETKTCGSIANASSKSICTDAFTGGVDQAKSDSGGGTTTTKEQGTQYCVGQYPSSQAKATACSTIYNHVLNDSTNDSATYCQTPPGGFSSATCNTIYQAALQNKPGGDTTVTGQPGDPGTTGTGTGGGATTPTCESSGFSASWVLCPIFNLVSGGSHFIFQSILQPFLVTQPITTSTSDPTYQIWSNFRIYGDIFLIIALLVVVFGESIGGGLIDAYTAKKILPRLLTAAILINLSIYIVAALVDATNILGKGISGILTAPLTNCTAGAGNCWNFSLSNTDIVSVFGVGIVGFLATSTAIAGLLGSILFGGGVAVTAAFTAAFFIAIPMLFAILSVFLTLIFRKGLILFLVLISPVAFSLYVLPNTERHFKRWWDLLVEALMIYPIIVLIFGVADILSITLLQANSIIPSDFSNNSSVTGHISFDVGRTLALVAAFLLQFLPLFAIPFSFRFASGALGRVYGAATSAGGVAHKALTGRREQAKLDYNAQALQGRDRVYRGLNSFGDTYQGPGRGIVKRGSRMGAGLAGGHNLEALISANRAEVNKQMQAINDSGDDTEERALTVNKEWADRHGIEGTHVRTDAATGKKQYRTLGGAWVDESAVDSAHKRWFGNQAAMQWAVGHEMEKAATQEEHDYMKENFRNVMSGGDTGEGTWAASDGQLAGLWKGAAFSKQNIDRQWKHYGVSNGGELTMGSDNALTLFREIDEKQGNYQMMQNNADTWTTMSQAMSDSSRYLDGHNTRIRNGDTTITAEETQRAAQAQEILDRGARIANATRAGSMAASPIDGEDGSVVGMRPGAAGGANGRQVGAGAPGRVQEEITRFTQVSDATAGTYRAPRDANSTSPARAPVDSGDSFDSIDRRRSDRTGPTDPNGTGTGGAGPRTS